MAFRLARGFFPLALYPSILPPFHLKYYICSYAMPSLHVQTLGKGNMRDFPGLLRLTSFMGVAGIKLREARWEPWTKQSPSLQGPGAGRCIYWRPCSQGPPGTAEWGLWASPSTNCIVRTTEPPEYSTDLCHLVMLNYCLKRWNVKVNYMSKYSLFSLQQKWQLFLCMTNLFLLL